MAQSDSRLFGGLFVALIVLAWVSLAAWGASPYSDALSHAALGDSRVALDGEYLAIALAFIGGWSLMTVAMMLPTSLPLILLFRTFVQQRRRRRLLVGLLLFGYLSTWVAVGVIAHVGDLGVHRAVEATAWLDGNSWLVGAAPLFVAGVYQFTPLKYLCLDKCRSPYGFILSHWRGGNEPLQALRLGFAHGLFCVGCCWSLMLLMFAVGAGNLAWMLVLAAVMATEKNLPWGRTLSKPLGVALVVAGLAVVGANVDLSAVCAHDGVDC